MSWARAVVHLGLGTALIEYWNLTDIEWRALVMAKNGELTEAEKAAEQKQTQLKLAAELNAFARR